MKITNKDKNPNFFKRTREEIKLKLSCDEALKYREEKKQRLKMNSLFQVKDALEKNERKSENQSTRKNTNSTTKTTNTTNTNSNNISDPQSKSEASNDTDI